MHPTNNPEAVRFQRDYKGFRVSRRFSLTITTYRFTCRKCKQTYIRTIEGVDKIPDFPYSCEHKVLFKNLPTEVTKLEAWLRVAAHRHKQMASTTSWMGKDLSIGLLKFESFVVQILVIAKRLGITRICPDSLEVKNKDYGMSRDNLNVQRDYENVWPSTKEIQDYFRSAK